MQGLYLLHLEPRYAHAGHYLGFASDIRNRVLVHAGRRTGRPSPLIRAALAAGCQVTVTRVWNGGDRNLERRLKRQGGLSRHCPTCRLRGDFHR